MRYYTYPSTPAHYSGYETQDIQYTWDEDFHAYNADVPSLQPPLTKRLVWKTWESNAERRWDYKARTFPHMQDMIRTRNNHGYFSMDDGVSDYGTISPHPIGNPYGVGIQRSESSFRVYNPERLYHSFFENVPLAGDTPPEDTIGSTFRMYDRLQYPITERVLIERNPFDSEFSIWMLGQDLVELPKLIVSIQGLFRALRKIKLRDNIMKLPYRDVMNGILTAEFGVLPSIADIRDFIDIVKRWGELLEHDGAMTRTYTYRKPIRVIEQGRVFERSYGSGIPGANVVLHMKYSVGVQRLYMLAKYYFVCPELHGLMARVKLAVDRLGLLDPAAAWDRVPFSFVVDWFADIGGWLHRNLKPNWYPADVVVTDWAETLIRDTDYAGYLTFSGPDMSRALVEREIWHRYEEKLFLKGVFHQYARKRQFPAKLEVDRKSLDSSLRKTWIKTNRIIIGSCLVGQRAKVRYRPGVSSHYSRRGKA